MRPARMASSCTVPGSGPWRPPPQPAATVATSAAMHRQTSEALRTILLSTRRGRRRRCRRRIEQREVQREPFPEVGAPEVEAGANASDFVANAQAFGAGEVIRHGPVPFDLGPLRII